MEKTVFDLSMSQTNIWDLENSYKSTPMNAISCTIEIKGRMNFELLQSALNQILAADSSLRLQIKVVDGNAMQCAVPWQKTVFPTYDFSQSDRKAFQKWEQMMAREPIPVKGGPLYRFVMFRTGERSGGVLVKMHHIISDGWTQMMICNRIASVYLSLLSGENPDLEESPSYRLHVEQEQEYLAGKMMLRDKKYWEAQLAGEWQPALLKQERGASCSPLGHRSSYQISEVLGHKMYQFCMENRVSPFLVFYLAFAVYLNRKEDISRFSVGVPLYNRSTKAERETTGMFVSTLPFICEIQESMTVLEAMEHVALEWFEMMRHQKLPFTMISNLASRSCPEIKRLFHIAISYQDSKVLSNGDTSVTFAGEWFYSGYQAEHLCIHLHNREKQNQFSVNYDYLLQVFSQREIEELHQSLVRILEELTEWPNRRLEDLEVMRADEKELVLYEFNRTEQYLPKQRIYDVFLRVVTEQENRAAVICNGARTTYGELWKYAGRIAKAIRKQGKEQGIAAVLLPRSMELLAAMVGALRAGFTWVLLSPQLPEYRIEKILQQSETAVVITDAQQLQSYPGLQEYGCIDVELLPEEAEDENTERQMLALETPLYLVYTSGSTGEPKGVEVGQRAFLNFVQAMRPIYSQRAVLSVCNPGFDAFLIETMAAFLNGRTVVMAQEEDLQKPVVLADLIGTYGVGFLSLTPSRLQALMAHRGFRQALRHIDRIICGGEKFPAELVTRLEQYTNAKVFNQYGPSEAAVGVCIKCMNYAERVTVGAPMQNCRAYILNKNKKPLPIGAKGRLFLGGQCLANGYKNNEELTNEKFTENPFEWQERIYDTGDLAAWTSDGEILLFGRTDQQVKLRGLRLELEEISGCMMKYPGVLKAYARIYQEQNQERLCAYYVSDKPVSEWELREFLGQRLPVYMLPDYLRQLDEIPLTANGKVAEEALPVPKGDIGSGEPENGMQQQILKIFTASLHGISMGIRDDYFRAGGNSLSSMQVLADLEDLYEVMVLPTEFYAHATVEAMETFLRRRLNFSEREEQKQREIQLVKAPELELYPTTSMQQAMFVHAHLEHGEYLYHMPGIFFLSGSLDEKRFWDAVQKLVDGEEVLRTGFVITEKGVFQKIAETCVMVPSYLGGETIEEAKKQFLRPFDLERPPLLHCALWKKEGQTAIFLDLHHLVGDGMSTPLMLKRLSDLYVDGHTQWPEFSFKDYAYEQEQRRAEVPEYDKHYWIRQMDGCQKLLLPTDESRSGADLTLGADVFFTLDEKQTAAVDAWCRRQGTTAFALFFGAFVLLMRQLTGTEDIIVGTPVSGRYQTEMMQICGPFIHTLPLRVRAEEEMTVADFFAVVRENVLGLLEHQEMNVDLLEKLCNVESSPGENPFFEVVFSMRPMETDTFSFAGQSLRHAPIETGRTKFELSLEASKEDGKYMFWFQYASALFQQETIAFYGRCMRQIIAFVLADSKETLSALSPMPQVDEMHLFREPMYEVLPFLDLPVDQQIALQCQMMPEETALIWHDQRISRTQFFARTQQIARFLQQQGIKKDDIVGICCRRTPDLFSAMLAVLMTGAAYMPILPSYPGNRMQHMCEIADIAMVLCDTAGMQKLPDELIAYASVLEQISDTENESTWTEPTDRSSSDAFCVLFTSGTTGEPKGAVLTHRGVNNVYANLKDLYGAGIKSVLCATNVTFDTAISEIVFPMLAGKTIVLADEEEMMLPWRLAELAEKYEINWMQITPSRMKVCMDHAQFRKAFSRVESYVTCGEVLTRELSEQIYKAAPDVHMVDLYGPTEGSIYVTRADCRRDGHMNIGRPFYNNRIYLLDENRRRVLPTAVGEIYIAGIGVTEGYIHRPELTNQVFVEDPFYAQGKMYKTGDFGRLRMDGTIDFCGRIDHQVKLNGQRVELEEIELAMRKTRLAKQAVIVPVMEDGRMKALRAYYVPQDKVISGEQFRKLLERELPVYMIPAEFTAVFEIPLTATGKTDYAVLRSGDSGRLKSYLWKEANAAETDAVEAEAAIAKAEPEEAPAEAEKPEAECILQPEPERKSKTDAQDVYALWCRVLDRPEIYPEQSFFAQGGTSLAAMQVLSGYYDRGIQMTMEQFFRNPSLIEQMRLLAITEEETSVVMEPSNEAEDVSGEEVKPGQAIVLTGATGYLGAHVLRELLLRMPREQEIICFVRKSALKEISGIWSHYFGDAWSRQTRSQVKIEVVNLLEEGLGMEPQRYQELAEKTAEIYHCAADVRHFAADDSILQTNREGTRHMLAFAERAGAAFQHISTMSVSGSYVKEFPDTHVPFEEEDYDLGQNWESNQYVKSKFLAEGLVRNAFARGLRGHIFRIGRLVGRASDGKFQLRPQKNAFYQMVQGLTGLQYLPESFAGVKMDLTPVDLCASWIVLLHEGSMRTYHLMGSFVTLKELILTLCPQAQICEEEVFLTWLQQQMQSEKGAKMQAFYEQLLQGREHPVMIEPENKKTLQALREAGAELTAPDVMTLLQEFVTKEKDET